MADDDAKAKLYKQVVQQANEQTVLQQMRIYGFWPRHVLVPPDPPDEVGERLGIDEIAELQKTQKPKP